MSSTVVLKRYLAYTNVSSFDGIQQALSRPPCSCEDTVWICSPCGQSLRAADTTYMRGWSWRTRYSTCGGFGTGLGEGVEGVECGRGKSCFDTRIVEKEVECDAGELAAIEAETEKARLAGHVWAGNSYSTQEMVGIGGQVKIKVKKIVVVGAVVKEHEDERADGNYLYREQQGFCRSWCSWCDR